MSNSKQKSPKQKTSDASQTIQKIRVGDSPIHGQGVFAQVDIKAGEVIERCPYLVIDDDDLAEEIASMIICSPALTRRRIIW